ncbi:Alpha/Beta hydrolase protein [Mycena capillaripes]|nr:Alpha/Beta hydrolase protein [Mycena capillaripes]
MSLVPLSFGADGNPRLILVHDISGSPFAYLPFCLDTSLSQYTIFGISALSESESPQEFAYPSVSAWAEAYATLIESELCDELKTDGRVFLGGWSLGGLLAAEIARIFARRLAKKVHVLGLVLIDTYAPWHELPVRMGPRGLEGGGAVIESAYFTPAEMARIVDLLTATDRDAWPGMDRTGCPAWLFTPSVVGANGLEEWFPDEQRVRRIGRGKSNHFSMMKEEWIGEVIAGVHDALEEIMRKAGGRR